MSSKLAQALDCSLDDYIAQKGIVASLRQKSNNDSGSDSAAGVFKRPLRSEMDDNEEEEDDLLYIEDRNGMDITLDSDDPPLREIKMEAPAAAGSGSDAKPTNVSIQLDTDQECRTFTTEEHKRGIKNIPSQQWRLRRENQVFKKPAGVPPLMSVKEQFDRNTDQLIASLGENAKFANPDARNRLNQGIRNNRYRHNRNRNFYNNNNNNNNGNNNNNFNRNRNNQNRSNGHIWNHNNRPQLMNNNANFNPNMNRAPPQNVAQMNKSQIRDLRPFISPPSSFQSHPNNSMIPLATGAPVAGPSAQFGQPQLVTFAEMLNQIGQVSTNQNREMFADVMRNVMRTQQQPVQQQSAVVPMMNPAAMSATELMPFAAQTLLNHITTVQENFGPKYDMKVQKEIHALQGKSMLYRSNGVVSMDGPGVDEERVQPVSTDLSMNMRFS